MSGIIGGAGSRSGIIGTTELDYEEGTWTPTGTNITGAEGVYIKIGRKVWCQAWFQANGGTTSTDFYGIPYTTNANNNGQGAGSVSYQNQNTPGTITWNVHLNANNTVFNFRVGSQAQDLTGSNQAHFAFGYLSAGVT